MATESQESQDIPDHRNIRKRSRTPLDNSNTEYFQWKQNEGNNVKDFLQVIKLLICLTKHFYNLIKLAID